MTGFHYYLKVLKQYADVSGRASRSEYWYFTLFNMIIYFAIYVLGFIVPELFLMYYVYLLVVFIPSFCVGIRRLHDIGKSGWNYLYGLIPGIGFIIILVWAIMESEPGENKWGPNPWEEGDFQTDISDHLV